MARYIRLVKLTREGAMNLRSAPERLAIGRKYLESLGGKIVDAYAVMGPYDIVAIIEAPSDEVAIKSGMYGAQAGLAEFTTMPATPIETFFKWVGEIPKD